jgi:hypothetical protein
VILVTRLPVIVCSSSRAAYSLPHHCSEARQRYPPPRNILRGVLDEYFYLTGGGWLSGFSLRDMSLFVSRASFRR